jgi:hypothetical protein
MFCGNPAVSLPPSRWRAAIIGCGFPTSERNARAHGTYPLYSIRIRVRENPHNNQTTQANVGAHGMRPCGKTVMMNKHNIASGKKTTQPVMEQPTNWKNPNNK